MTEQRCDSKRCYKSEKAARTHLRQMKRRSVDIFRLNVYWCERHNGWHIGNQPIHGLRNL